MRMQIESIKANPWNAEDFKDKYGEILAAYDLEIVPDTSCEDCYKAYITISSLDELIELEKALSHSIILMADKDEILLTIYDDFA